MDITKIEIETYKKMLKAEKKLPEIVEALSPTQRKFCDVVVAILDRPSLGARDIAKQMGCGYKTVYRALNIIKGCYLPFRMSERLQCRMLEKKFKGEDTQLGRMTEGALQGLFAMRRKRG